MEEKNKMEERKTVGFKKEEFSLKEHVKKYLGMGKVSRVKIEYTPVGEKIIITTHKPGLIIGRKGEKIIELTNMIKKKFKLENPHIEIEEIKRPEFDPQLMAEDIASGLERMGPVKFKVIIYRALQRIVNAGALGVEIRASGKLPGARAKTWRFAQGYLKKTGNTSKLVNKAYARAETKPGTVGIKVSILSPGIKMIDKIIVDEAFLNKLKEQNLEPIKKISKNKK
jgi:small subunit ribosomal protein S3